MPTAPKPESLLSQRDLAKAVETLLPKRLRETALGPRAIELRPVDPINPFKPTVRPPKRMVWYKTTEQLPDQPKLHQHILAYASDFSFLTTALQPHGVSWLDPEIRMASLDHAMWFHRPFRIDDWILHVMESPSAYGARGYVRGEFYTKDGQLIASTAQEGIIRMKGWQSNTG